ncbi:carotenoid biosynthesis protein [Aquimarina algiphila]|uniref:carotenoid biosynthesis protein n=1 Tax=Aquimarina algiphila TaxID=2047982 RepID=UPI0023307D88|nr:carotenoid biosynthesis protein [Aquimarina algiphila]
MNSDKKRQFFIIAIIWIFNISGIIGILIGYEDWFLPLTPLHLLIYLFLILWDTNFNRTLILALMIPFGIGMITEYLGVNYDLIFGNYEYGKNLGYKICGVPLIIGVNWVILTYSSAAIAQKVHDNLFITSAIGAVLMVGLDTCIEMSAPRFDFWEFEGGVIPLQNYIGWLFTGFVAHVFLQKIIKAFHFKISLHIFIAILVFFTIFLFV